MHTHREALKNKEEDEMKTELVKGFRDYTGEEAKKRAEIKKILIEIFEKYGFEPAETPIIEREEFVKGENVGDEAVSDIFRLSDKGKRKLALRYELTFPLKRIMKNKKLPYKRYQIGPVFRDEPVSANRFRQFTQCDVDVIGSSIKDEAEVLATVKDISKRLGIKLEIYVNNRRLLNEILEQEKVSKKEEVIRIIDKLDKKPEKEVREELRKYKAEEVIDILKESESYFKKYKAYSEIEELKKYCKFYNVKIVFSPSLARGLSYYTGNVFEIKTDEFRETICAGGSYEIEGKKATGISFGLDRISQLAKLKLQKEKFLVMSLEQDEEAIKIVRILRKQNKIVSLFYGKPSKALEFANSYKINNVIFVGDKEVRAKKYKVKDMISGKNKGFKI